MEKMMGRAENPLRSILHWSSKEFLEKELDLWYILTVIGRDGTKGNTVIRGLFIGNDIECYKRACALSIKGAKRTRLTGSSSRHGPMPMSH